MTSQRQVIIKVIEESDDHPDVDQLYLRSVQIDNTISIATVYRTVKLLEEAGLIERLEFGDGRSRYEEAGEHHEHLVDVETGEVFEFYNEELEALKEEIARKMGYDLIDHRLELYGKKIKGKFLPVRKPPSHQFLSFLRKDKSQQGGVMGEFIWGRYALWAYTGVATIIFCGLAVVSQPYFLLGTAISGGLFALGFHDFVQKKEGFGELSFARSSPIHS